MPLLLLLLLFVAIYTYMCVVAVAAAVAAMRWNYILLQASARVWTTQRKRWEKKRRGRKRRKEEANERIYYIYDVVLKAKLPLYSCKQATMAASTKIKLQNYAQLNSELFQSLSLSICQCYGNDCIDWKLIFARIFARINIKRQIKHIANISTHSHTHTHSYIYTHFIVLYILLYKYIL